jgi:hypothetical protein
LHEYVKRLRALLRQPQIWGALLLQLALSIPFAHGYDFRVEYVAGRNIVEGLSPYFGGVVTGWMSIGFGPQVQGIGETPLWALYMGLCIFLSAGQVFVFNFLTKIPIVAANLAFAAFAYWKGVKGWRFFLFNIYLLSTSVTWGKPDVLAALLAIVALLATDSAIGSAFLLSTSFMIKPLAVAILPAFFLRLTKKPAKWRGLFVLETTVISAGMFLGPFLLLHWPIETVTAGFPSWFGRVGAMSIFNLLKMQSGNELLPSNLWWIGYLVILGTVALTAYALIRRPNNTLRYALLSSAVFFTLRSWNSEQNLVIVLALFILLNGQLPSRLLWVLPVIFAFVNTALPQQLYLLMPTIIDKLSALTAPFAFYLLWLKFALALAWLIVLWVNVHNQRPL